jgi:hypothetical protein
VCTACNQRIGRVIALLVITGGPLDVDTLGTATEANQPLEKQIRVCEA